MDTYFNFNRFLLVLQRDLFENIKSALFGILTVLSIFSFILLMTTFDTNQTILTEFGNRLYLIEFWFIGIFFSGMAFKEFRNKEKSMAYLMLPASSLEKFLSTLFLTTIGFFISYTLFFGIFNLLNMGIISSFSETLSLELYNPFNQNVWSSIMVFIPVQAIFLAGATTFKKVPLFYTVLYFFLFMLVYGFVASLLLKFYTGKVSIGSIGDNNGIIYYNSGDELSRSDINDILSIQTFMFFLSYLLAPIFWVIAWFKIKEKEV